LSIGDNDLDGNIPLALSDLPRLRSLNLELNSLSGHIPHELGQLRVLEVLRLGQNALTGTIPPELGNLSQLRHLSFHENQLSGVLPLTLTALGELTTFWYFGQAGQTVCAPQDAGFHNWLASITDAIGPTCTFVAIENNESVPEPGFFLLGNFPNPFNSSTSIAIQLSESARIQVEVLDITGRKALETSIQVLPPGRQLIPIQAKGLSSGIYYYRVLVEAQEKYQILTGSMSLIR
ncbi:MAG: T9SS type A sorting domain-containing protein, partial [Rhodothermaceae bacterium]|nr:T9SS type A sorting domain-containing protein [Rhodothermaceae bacterium]